MVQPWLEARLTPGTALRIRGKQNRFGFQVESYDFGDASETADFAPVYPATADLAQKQLRALVFDDVPLIFVHYETLNYLMRKNVTGSTINPTLELRSGNWKM